MPIEDAVQYLTSAVSQAGKARLPIVTLTMRSEDEPMMRADAIMMMPTYGVRAGPGIFYG